MEIFKDIPGYEGLYQVSDLGKIPSVKRNKYMKTKYRFSGKLNGRTFLPYEVVNLSKDGKYKTFVVHRLVLLSFEGPCPIGCIAMHENDNPKDNRLCNLKWGTYQENVLDTVKKGRRIYDLDFIKTIGKKNGMNKKVIMINADGKTIKEFESVREAGRKLSIPSTNISDACNGKRNSAGGYHWKHA